MKRTYALLLAVLMLISVFSGCTQSSEQDPAVTPSNASETATESPAPPESKSVYPIEGGGKLTLYGEFKANQTGGLFDSRGDSIPFQVAEEATGVKITFIDNNQETYAEKLNLLLAGGDLPDLIFGIAMNYSTGVDAAIDDGVILDIAEYLDYAPAFTELIMGDDTLKKSVHTDTGKIGAFYMIEDEESAPGEGPIVRKDLLDKVGMDVPETIDEYHDVLAAFKDAGVDMPMYVGTSLIDGLAAAYDLGALTVAQTRDASGLQYFQVDGKIKLSILEDDYETVLQIMKDWLDEGLYSRDFMTISTSMFPPSPDFTTAITTGTTGLYIGTSNPTTLVDTGRDSNPDFELTAAPLMRRTEGQLLHLGANYHPRVDKNGFSLSGDCSDIELACRYMDWWYTEEGSLTASYGKLGLTYELDENGAPYFTEYVTNNPDNAQSEMLYYSIIESEMGLIDADRMLPLRGEYSAKFMPVWGQNNDNAYFVDTHLSMTAEESERYNAVHNDIATYVEENVPKFILGELPMSDLENFKQNLYDMGIEECIQIYQDAYDRLLAR